MGTAHDNAVDQEILGNTQYWEFEDVCGKDIDTPTTVTQCQRLANHKGKCHSCCEECAVPPTLSERIPTVVLQLTRFILRPIVRIYGWADDELERDYTLFQGGEGKKR